MATQFSDGSFPSDTENVSNQMVDRGMEMAFGSTQIPYSLHRLRIWVKYGIIDFITGLQARRKWVVVSASS